MARVVAGLLDERRLRWSSWLMPPRCCNVDYQNVYGEDVQYCMIRGGCSLVATDEVNHAALKITMAECWNCLCPKTVMSVR